MTFKSFGLAEASVNGFRKRGKQKFVMSFTIDYVNRAGASNAILRDVLGIDSTMLIWATEELENIIEKYSHCNFSKDNLEALRTELSSIGLADYIPESIAQVAERTVLVYPLVKNQVIKLQQDIKILLLKPV